MLSTGGAGTGLSGGSETRAAVGRLRSGERESGKAHEEHAVRGGPGQKGRLGEGVGGKGLQGLWTHLRTPGWVDVAGQSWPGSLALLKRRTESPRFSPRCTLHGPPPAGPVAALRLTPVASTDLST